MQELFASLKSVTKKEAAIGHLETAIWLWFHEDDETTVGDPPSVHTLAVASQGVLTAICRDRDVEISRLAKVMSCDDKDLNSALRNPQNFYKHGHYGARDKKKHKVHQLPDFTEMILVDNVSTYNRVFGLSTPLLDVFMFRFSLMFPESKVSLKTYGNKLVERGLNVASLARLSRKRFYDILVPLFIEFTAADRTAHSGMPPE